jgi:multiple sugar transport system permease protein
MGIKSRRFFARLITHLLLLLGSAIVFVPFWYMASTSFKPQTYVFEMPPRLWPAEFTFQNYIDAVTRDAFGQYFLNSVFVACVSTILTVLIASLMAYGFARLKFPGKKALFYVLLVGMMIPPVMLIIPQFIISIKLKLFDRLLGLIVVYIAMNLPMQTYLLRGFFEGIPKDLEEAGLIDGASPLQIFWRIILPLSKPGLATATIFTFLYCWDEFPWAHVAIKETSRRTLPIAIALFQSQHLTQWGLVFAASIIALIPVLIVFIIFQRYFVQGISTTGLKG